MAFTASSSLGKPGPSRLSDSPVSAGNVFYEAFVLMGELRWSFSSMLSLSSRKSVKTNTIQFPPSQKKALHVRFSAETGLSETLLGPV